MKLLILSLTLLQLTASDDAATTATDEVYRPVPACGVMAAYSLLQCFGVNKEMSPAEVEDAFKRSLVGGANLAQLSMADLRRGLESLSLPTEAVRIKDRQLTALTPPCILYFQPGSGVGDVRWENGHYLTLVKFAQDRAIIVDWVDWTVSPSRHLPISELQEEWTGEAVVYPRSFSARSYFRWVLIAAGLVLLTLAIRSRWRSMRSGVALTLLTSVFGCNQAEPPVALQPSTLSFVQPVAILGEVSATKVLRHDFKFQTWALGPVTISAIHTSCACTTSTTNLIGRSLDPETEYSLPIQIRPQKENSSTTQTIRIETSPPSSSPLALAVQYRVESGPEPNTKLLIATSAHDAIPEVTLHIVDRRSPGSPVVRVNQSNSSATHFRLKKVERSTQVMRLNQHRPEEVAVDTTAVLLTGQKQWPVGEHQGIVSLQFSDGSSKTVRTLIRVPSPFQPELNRVFCGFLKPGQTWSAAIKCRRFDLPESVRVSVAASNENTVAQLSSGDIIRLSGRAPVSAGRFAETITITVADETIPPVEIPISGIVSE